MRSKLIVVVSLLLLISVVLSACGGATSAATAPATAAPMTEAKTDWSTVKSAAEAGGLDQLIAAAKAEGKLSVIALPRDWCNYGEMIDTFEQKYGLDVTELNPEAGSADELEAIRANKESKGPQAPDVVDVGVAYGPTSKEEGLLAPYKVQGWDSIAGLKDPDGYWYSDYGGVLAFQVNTDLVKKIPQDWADLLSSDYQGQVALAGDPRASNQAVQTVQAAALANGGAADDAQPGLAYFKQLNEAGNLLPVIATSGTFAKGETPITFAWDYLAKAARDNFKGNPGVEIVYPKSGTLGGFYVQGISAYAPNPAAARLWQEFLYSDEGQQIWMKGYCVPSRYSDLVKRNAVSAELMAKMPAKELLDAAVFATVDQLSTVRETIKAEWDKVVGVDVKQAP
jgi:putative spermidine/putrescine transport system substrate-binding protein